LSETSEMISEIIVPALQCSTSLPPLSFDKCRRTVLI
jgi:hypothetical protein